VGKRVVLVVVDGLGRTLFDRAIDEGRAPTLARLRERGTLHPPAASSFPSLTPVCLSAIATGEHPEGSYIPSLTWFRRGEGRFVEYGSSFGATLREGALAAINDSILNLNHLHLSQRTRTLFELVEDAGLVAGSINFFVFRGRQRHSLKHRPAARLARRIGVFDAAYGPTRFFFGELFASDRTGAPSNLGVQGRNDVQAGAIGRWLVARDGFDFLLHYLPEVDMASHRIGPEETLDTVERADDAIATMMSGVGDVDAFLERYAVIVVADHGQVPVRRSCDLAPALEGLELFVSSHVSDPGTAQVALAASNRFAMVYRLAGAPSARDLAGRLERTDGVDLVVFVEDGRFVVRRDGAELAFRRATHDEPDAVLDRRGSRYLVEGDDRALLLEREGAVVSSPAYPNALERIAGLLASINAGEVAASAGPGVEFVDAGGSDHVGGGSHGSLSVSDSSVPFLTAGFSRPVDLPAEPSITDVYGLVARELGLEAEEPPAATSLP
jgi:Type I phosphodiesterase / nucleotide pyrophosphatase